MVLPWSLHLMLIQDFHTYLVHFIWARNYHQNQQPYDEAVRYHHGMLMTLVFLIVKVSSQLVPLRHLMICYLKSIFYYYPPMHWRIYCLLSVSYYLFKSPFFIMQMSKTLAIIMVLLIGAQPELMEQFTSKDYIATNIGLSILSHRTLTKISFNSNK